MRAAGLFSGIGGLELGLERAGITTELLCEYWEPASSTLAKHFDAEIVGDIRRLPSLPAVDVVTAGFPCTDLSQVGRTAGIEGESGLVNEALRLIAGCEPTWVVLENVPNMLTLHGGQPMRHITDWFDVRGWNWAYRTVDSQFFGVRQRRRRVFLVASRTEDPRTVLFADDHGGEAAGRSHRAYGFSWTEGNRGLGWGLGVTPTLKGGSRLGIASPPGVWLPGMDAGTAIVRPSIEAGEKLQGFRSGWTSSAGREGTRWKLVGNAVTVPVAEWLGGRLIEPGNHVGVDRARLDVGGRWPRAASCVAGNREKWNVSEAPLKVRSRQSLAALLADQGAHPLSHKATSGFTQRLKRSTLSRQPEFMRALETHLLATR
jgi:DNA (cytosine-5)-methyltransferase 1